MSRDARTIERLIIPAMMQAIIIGTEKSLERSGASAGALAPVREALALALNEPIADMPPHRAGKLVRRAMRATSEAMTAVVDGRVIIVQYLAVARFTADLAERDVVTIGAASHFARAWDMMADILDVRDDDPHLAEAETIAHRLGGTLQGMGYFQR